MSFHIIESCGKIQEKWQPSQMKNNNQDHSINLESRLGSTKTPSFLARSLRSIETTFLPAGYPQSVTPDYLTYQVYDTLQALCSTITGTLATRAVLKGVGVGDATATAMSGTVSWLLRDGAGMIGRILFASVVASDLDHDAKRWRLAADVTNDIGLLINILSEHAPREYFIYLACISSLFFAVTGTAGGATRSSLTRHFSVSGFSVADLSAKEGNQETAVNLIGMFVGMAVAYLVPHTFTWTLCVVMFFTFLHLMTNYLGVKSLILEHLNENRLVICLDKYLKKNNNSPPSPIEMKNKENVVFPGKRIASIKIGVSLRDLLGEKRSADANIVNEAMKSLKTKGYFVSEFGMEVGKKSAGGQNGFGIALAKIEQGSQGEEDDAVLMQRIFLAYIECIVLHLERNESQMESSHYAASHVRMLKENPEQFLKSLKAVGWRVDRFQLRVDDWRISIQDDAEEKTTKPKTL